VSAFKFYFNNFILTKQKTMIGWIIDLLITALVILGAAYILPGVHIKSFKTAIWVAILIAIVDATVGGILRILAWPFNWLTFGLLYFVIYVIAIMLVDKLVSNFKIDGFWWAVIFAVVLSIAGGFINLVV
jgi:putative membrane protein